MVKPMRLIDIEAVKCQKRSLVVSEWFDTKNDIIIFRTCGGTQSKRVIDGLYPIVATMVGKNVMKDCEIFKEASAIANHHTVKSVRASTRPDARLLLSESSVISRRSSFILFCAKNCSSAVSHDARVLGKLGTM